MIRGGAIQLHFCTAQCTAERYAESQFEKCEFPVSDASAVQKFWACLAAYFFGYLSVVLLAAQKCNGEVNLHLPALRTCGLAMEEEVTRSRTGSVMRPEWV